jgi:hypothetical protein
LRIGIDSKKASYINAGYSLGKRQFNPDRQNQEFPINRDISLEAALNLGRRLAPSKGKGLDCNNREQV